MSESRDWLRVRGIGRERFVGYLADYLATLGYAVERGERTDPMESWLKGRLERPNPAVPASAGELEFRFYPTSGGAAVVWEVPQTVAEADRGRLDRLVREIATHLERSISTESHATAKLIRPSDPHLPWGPSASTAAAL